MLKKGIVGVLLLGIVFIGLSRMLGIAEGGSESLTSYVTYPFLVAQKALVAPFISWRERRRITHNLLDEYTQIVSQRDDLLKELIALKALSRHADDTKELREFAKRYTQDSVTAALLLRSFGGSDFFLVDAGESSGVTPDMIAVYNNSLIGKVTEVYPWYSKVQLITDPYSSVAAYSASNGVKAIYQGQKKGMPRLAYLDHRDELSKGDLILSSGEGGLFPRGFCLGKVTHIDGSSYERSVNAEPLVDLKAIKYCTLIPNIVNLKDQAVMH